MTSTVVRNSYRLSFLTLRNNVLSASKGIRTTLAPEGRQRQDWSHVHEEADSHGHHHTHTPPAALRLCPVKTFKSIYALNTTALAPTQVLSQVTKRYYSTNAAPEKKKVAVILSGSGVHDGSEIHESVSILIHLSKNGLDARCFAPEKKQADVINHVKGTPSEETRDVLVESARIARGKVKPLSQLKTEDYSAIVFPGGYGAAKNLCTFAKDGENCTVDAEVERIVKEFHAAKKPIAMACVSPVIAAKLIPGVKVTLGNDDKDAAQAIERMGAKPQPAGATDVVVDEENNIVSTPAYMYNSSVHKVHDGIGKMIESMISMIQKPAATN